MSAENQEAAPGKKGLPVKTIAVVLALLVAEGAGIFVFLTFFGGPAPVQAEGVELVDETNDPMEQLVEIPLLHEKLTNNSSGAVFLYDTEILIVVREKHKAKVEEMMAQSMGAIRTGLAQIWQRAEHSYFGEPGWETLTRQSREFLDSRFKLQDDSGDSLIEQVLIPKCLGFRADF